MFIISWRHLIEHSLCRNYPRYNHWKTWALQIRNSRRANSTKHDLDPALFTLFDEWLLKLLQALLRGRFLRNDRSVDHNRSTSVAESELGFLRRKQTVSGLRYPFFLYLVWTLLDPSLLLLTNDIFVLNNFIVFIITSCALGFSFL